MNRPAAQSAFHVRPEYQPWMRQIGLDADAVFAHPQIVPWRRLADRENCTLDATVDHRPVRLHIKRWFAGAAAADEVRGIERLNQAGIATVPLVGWGQLADGRSFLITEDLAGYRDAEKLVADGLDFERLLQSTAALAGRLHASGLQHRDLYLCHFFACKQNPADVRLIDAARVRPMGRLLRRRRIIKDLAQILYSTSALSISDHQRQRWLEAYTSAGGASISRSMGRAIDRKVRWIGQHDRKLKQAQPLRNVSIPER